MRSLVINLDRSVDRLAHITAEFEKAGLAFERVPAVSSDKIEMGNHAPHLSPGIVATFLSHRVCWASIAQGPDEYGAVFEDDIVFAEGAGSVLRDVSWIPSHADIVKLETFFNVSTVLGLLPASAPPSYSTARLFGDHAGCAGYIVSRSAASRMLAATERVTCPADGFLFGSEHQASMQKIVYQLVPALCVQGMHLSSMAAQLPSEAEPHNAIEHAPKGSLRRKTILRRLSAETRRLGQQISNLRRLRRRKVVPFVYNGQILRESLQ